MPGVARLGDSCSGCCAPPDVSAAGAGTVMVNGMPAVRVGDPYVPHACPLSPPHGRSAAAGSGTVIIEGMPVQRIGDAIDCGATVAVGSDSVIAG